MVLSLLLAFLLVLSLISQFSSGIAGHTDTSDPGYYGLSEVVLENHFSDNKILLLPVSGIITRQSRTRSGEDLVNEIKHQLHLAATDRQIKGVLLHVDSPGGEVLAADEIYRLIQDFQAESGKPVVAYLGSLAASGGYYISAPCQWIVSHELTITGSIGVILSGFNYRELMDKVGVRPMVFKSGRFKDMLSGTQEASEISEEEKAMVQALVDETFDHFKEVVREGRSYAWEQNESYGARSLAENWTDYADGRILSGRQAFELGFVDELGSLNSAFDRLLELTASLDANLIRYQRPMNISRLFRLFGRSSEEASIKLDWGVELPHLEPNRLYFLHAGTALGWQ